jgi:hypothetical protein
MITSSRASEARGGLSRLSRTRLLVLALAAAAGLGLLASACGGSSSQGVAEVETSETTTTGSGSAGGSSARGPAAFAACMRSNGVAKFPDPDADGEFQVEGLGIDRDSRQVRTAFAACRSLIDEPEGRSPAELARDRERLLAFAACMRKNGLPRFPDPNPSGGGLTLGRNSGLDPNSPQFRKAEKACEKLLGGGKLGSRRKIEEPTR